jgi:hypothetical protein
MLPQLKRHTMQHLLKTILLSAPNKIAKIILIPCGIIVKKQQQQTAYPRSAL